MTRILVIEPETRARHALRQMLEVAGYEVEVAVDGSEGMARHRTQPADLVIAELDDVAEQQEAFMGAKLIAVPGDGRMGCQLTAETARRMGAHGLLPKPFRRDDLLATVRATLASAHLREHRGEHHA